MLSFVGLGLFDERDISLKGLDAVHAADVVYVEFYTSRLTGTTIDRMERLYEKSIHPLKREDVEGDTSWLCLAREKEVVLLVGGDPMISTTHVDLRLRALEMGIRTRVIHSSNISSAASGITGLQNYRFGRSVSVPFPYTVRGKRIVPKSPYNVLKDNLKNNLHTLLYLDIQNDRNMTINEAAEVLLELADAALDKSFQDIPGIGVARAGSSDCVVKAERMNNLKDLDFGPPLHVMVVPAKLHFMEAMALKILAGAPDDLVDNYQC